MPTYDYLCTACGHEFEEYQSMTAKVLTKCPNCGKKALKRLIGTGAAIVFKGSGFYQTDYRSESYKKAAEADSKSSTPAADPKTSEAAKPDTSTTKNAEPSERNKPSEPSKPAQGAKPSESAKPTETPKPAENSKPKTPDSPPASRSVTGGRAGRGKGNTQARKKKGR